MKIEVITIGGKRLKKKPNLENYENTYKNFSYKKYENELGWFDCKRRLLNTSYNAIDKHLNTWAKNKTALIWESESGKVEEYSFLDLALLSNKFANILKKYGIKKKDRVFIFLPRVPELYISFLGVIKTGAIAGTMFSAFGPKGIFDRLENSEAVALVTDSELKGRLYEVAKKLPNLKYVFVVTRHSNGKAKSRKQKKKFRFSEILFEDEMAKASDSFSIAKTKSDDFAFMLYTSGTTGKPKGVMHQHYSCLHEHLTAKWVLDITPEDVYWCTADPGWVTGIAYEILGTWSNAATTLVYQGRFDAAKWYDIIQKHKVNVWYTAPTAIRMLAAAGGIYKKYNLSSLRHICSVGEPLNPEPIRWGMKAFHLPFHDNFWQTETGGIVIANYPCLPIKLGSMGKPVPGIKATIIDDSGRQLKNNQIGNLALRPGWPSMMQDIWKNKKKYHSYFKRGWYVTGDLAYVDKEGYFWFIGRADDVIKTAGERVGPFEVESALVEHPAVIEAGVIGKPDPVRGEIIKAFVVLKEGIKPTEKLKDELSQHVRKKLAGHAYPREIQFESSLPKTRSGKIMRRLLKAKELGLPLGDTSTLEKF